MSMQPVSTYFVSYEIDLSTMQLVPETRYGNSG